MDDREQTVTLREGTTPALTRALRAGTLDLAILAQTPPFRPPDNESPALKITTISERELVIGVFAGHPFASVQAVEVDQLTTLAPITLGVLPAGVKVVAVRGEPHEIRRIVIARRPGPLQPAAVQVTDALIAAAWPQPLAAIRSVLLRRSR